MPVIGTEGALDWACPPFIMATTAAAMGIEAAANMNSSTGERS